MSYDCLECRKEFSSRKSLHLHLKKHGGMAPYYHKHFPRRDLLTGELIDFENSDQYLRAIFQNEENQSKHLSQCSKNEGRDLLVKHFTEYKDGKGGEFFPCQNYLKLAKLPTVDRVKFFYGDCKSFCDEVGLGQIYNKRLPKEFSFEIPKDFQILIDTREQKPYSFKNSIQSKLDFGDYTVGGEYFTKTFVDRKSESDFKQTFGVGYQRFKKEADRAKSFNSFLFIVVEATIEDIKINNENTKFKTNLSYSFHNVRELLSEYPNNIQFVFCKDRDKAKKTTQKILLFGDKLWSCDLQYYIDHGLV